MFRRCSLKVPIKIAVIWETNCIQVGPVGEMEALPIQIPLFPFTKIELWKLSSGLLNTTKVYFKDLLLRILMKKNLKDFFRRHGNLLQKKYFKSLRCAEKWSLRNEKNEINQ